VYGLYIEVVGLAAHEAGFFVGTVGGRKIVEEVYPIEGMQLHRARQVHGCRSAGEMELTSREAGCLIIACS
jgi:hypothetical protein